MFTTRLVALLLIIIAIMIYTLIEMSDRIKKEREESKLYYAELRRLYDERIKEMQERIELEEEISHGYESLYKQGGGHGRKKNRQ